MAVLTQGRDARRGSTRFRETDLWNCSAGEDPLPEPFGALLRKEAQSERPRVLLQRNLTVEISAHEGCCPEPTSLQARES